MLGVRGGLAGVPTVKPGARLPTPGGGSRAKP